MPPLFFFDMNKDVSFGLTFDDSEEELPAEIKIFVPEVGAATVRITRDEMRALRDHLTKALAL